MKYNINIKQNNWEIHYLDIDANNKEDAEEQAYSYGVNSLDAHDKYH